MKTELLARSPLLVLPLIALFFFLVVFVGILVATMRKQARICDARARLPLDDEADAEAHEGEGR